jgi:hypothetical protein
MFKLRLSTWREIAKTSKSQELLAYLKRYDQAPEDEIFVLQPNRIDLQPTDQPTGEQVIALTTVALGISLSYEDIAGVLTSALEGGSNYWYFIEEYITPTTWGFTTEPRQDNGFHWASDYPLNVGGALMISDRGDMAEPTFTKRLDLEAITKGVAVLAEKYPHHLADILAENADAGTGDALLQCSLFGEIIYG